MCLLNQRRASCRAFSKSGFHRATRAAPIRNSAMKLLFTLNRFRSSRKRPVIAQTKVDDRAEENRETV
jgi:hypothetical protein